MRIRILAAIVGLVTLTILLTGRMTRAWQDPTPLNYPPPASSATASTAPVAPPMSPPRVSEAEPAPAASEIPPTLPTSSPAGAPPSLAPSPPGDGLQPTPYPAAETTPPPTAPIASPPPAVNDPIQVVDNFVERSRREADEAIRQLNSEAQELRERLRKVESALARWQRLSRALKQGNNAPSDLLPSGDVPALDAEKVPTDLSPIPAPGT